ncbi:MAG: porin, partial [Methylocella sp.]
PARQAAPIEYVRICDAQGAGFFYIPGTGTCLRVGGLALAEPRGFDPSFGSNGGAAPGSLGQMPNINAFNAAAGTSAPRLRAVLNKAFIQFAGLTAGQAQSMFDFYAGAYDYHRLRGSNATVALLAYTATFGDGFPATLSFEDQADRRAATGGTIASTTAAPIIAGGISATSFQARPGGSRVPEIVGNLRLDQPWGTVQLPGAAHQVRASLFGATALATPPTSFAFPALATNSYGFAVQGGVRLNVDYLSPGDKLWLQAAYEKGAVSYILGNNLAYSHGSGKQNQPGSAGTLLDYGGGGNPQINSQCVFTGGGTCEQHSGWDINGAHKHYWLPILSSAIYGSYMEMHYPNNALNGFGGAAGVSNIKDARIGTHLAWTPLKGFDIGAEFMYAHLNETRPAGLAPDSTLTAAGLPAFQPNNTQYEGRLRIQPAF